MAGFVFLKHTYSFIPLSYGLSCSDEKLVSCRTVLPLNISFFPLADIIIFSLLLFSSSFIVMCLDFDIHWLFGLLSFINFREFSVTPAQVLRRRLSLPFPPESRLLLSLPLSPLCILPSLCSFLGRLPPPVHSCAIRCLLGLKSSYYTYFLKVLPVLFRFGTSCLIV